MFPPFLCCGTKLTSVLGSFSSSPLARSRPMQTMSFQGAIATLNGLLSSNTRKAAEPPTDSNAADPLLPRHQAASLRSMANFERMLLHIQTLDMEEPLSRLSVIHVAGTKGKGSTCAFSESILRSCGYRTGLFTSPHLLDIRERIRFNGVEVSEEIFAKHFWWCWNRLQAKMDAGVRMPGFFSFITLLALKMFTSENVDVAILEVGLGGRYDATNIVKTPAVCGITSLGFDHMEILGNTLADIAGAKAGIFKAGVPAFSVPQEPEAMEELQKQAKKLAISLEVSPPLSSYSPDNIQLGLEGDHQRLNAALAVALCASWETRCGSNERLAMLKQGVLPDPYLRGLANTSWPGRAQVIHDMTVKNTHDNFLNGKSLCSLQKPGSLTFYLDGAHSPESMEACANWFCTAVSSEKPTNPKEANANGHLGYLASQNPQHQTENGNWDESTKEVLQCRRVLLFNCMPKRDPQLLFPPLIKTCALKGVPINMAIFVPPFSSTISIDTRSLTDILNNTIEFPPDLSWQKILQQTWESFQQEKCAGSNFVEASKNAEPCGELARLRNTMEGNDGHMYHHCTLGPSSAVMPSLPAAVNWLRCWATGNPEVQLQVLVTGSLYLVGDLLKILKI